MSGSISATTAALIAAGVGAAGIGTGVYESVKSSDENAANQAFEKQQLQQQQQAQANQANLSKQEAVLGAQGEAQQQTGGSLTDSGTTAFTDLLAGYPGYQAGNSSANLGSNGVAANSAVNSATNSAVSNANPIAALLAALRGGQTQGQSSSISGGNWQPPQSQPQKFQELSNPPLG